jgi:hypothetical protein
MKTAPKLTAKQGRENAQRADRAAAILSEYADMVGEEIFDRKTTLCDLLADMMHLMGADVVDRCMLSSTTHYEAERNGEP